MLRIHFSAEDLARTTLSSEPDPLWEVLLSLHMLQVGDGAVPYGAWRQRMRRELPREAIGPLLTLAPPVGYSPDFLTPNSQANGFSDAVDQMLSTPRRRVQTDLSRLSTRRSAAGWIGDLASARPDTLRCLGDSVRLYHRTALAPYWQSLRTAVQADHRVRSQELSSGGLAAMLEGLHPQACWRNQVLEISSFPDSQVHLNGRGLRLQPSYFCWDSPTKLLDDELPPVLVFPIDRTRRLLRTDPIDGSKQENLIALLGRTRATVLAVTAADQTTTQVADFCNITMTWASEQLAVLRAAGLVASRRRGKFVIHRATKLGQDILDGGDSGSGDISLLKTRQVVAAGN